MSTKEEFDKLDLIEDEEQDVLLSDKQDSENFVFKHKETKSKDTEIKDSDTESVITENDFKCNIDELDYMFSVKEQLNNIFMILFFIPFLGIVLKFTKPFFTCIAVSFISLFVAAITFSIDFTPDIIIPNSTLLKNRKSNTKNMK